MREENALGVRDQSEKSSIKESKATHSVMLHKQQKSTSPQPEKCNTQHLAVPRRIKELQSEGKSSGQVRRGEGSENTSKKKQYDLRSWCGGEGVREKRKKK